MPKSTGSYVDDTIFCLPRPVDNVNMLLQELTLQFTWHFSPQARQNLMDYSSETELLRNGSRTYALPLPVRPSKHSNEIWQSLYYLLAFLLYFNVVIFVSKGVFFQYSSK